ncbi:cell division protein ZapB [Dissulfuribacter thermophilus]|nr:cell division protein ZapB [Dissulfuribacter thermophilus]
MVEIIDQHTDTDPDIFERGISNMEQDLMVLLESKVGALMDRLDSVQRENMELKQEIDRLSEELRQANERIDDLELQKQLAREKIKEILDRIDSIDQDDNKPLAEVDQGEHDSGSDDDLGNQDASEFSSEEPESSPEESNIVFG